MFEGTKTYTKEEATCGEGKKHMESLCKNEDSKKGFDHSQKRKATTSKSEDKLKGNLITKVNNE